jgi:hypothetical protein
MGENERVGDSDTISAGPSGWLNWQGHRLVRAGQQRHGHRQGYTHGPSSGERFESALYSDAEIHGNEVVAGPYKFINTMAHAGEGGGPVLVLRSEWHLEWDLDPSRNETDDSRYVGGSTDDEMAALMSLAIGRRLRAGGVVRTWRDGDPIGRPQEYDRQPQIPIRSRRGSVIPCLRDPVNFELARDLVRAYGQLGPDEAVSLARAARLYSNAVWVADSDPNAAWLWLVSAVETAATASNTGVGAGKRFRRFMKAHQPSPPDPRAPWTRIEWAQLDSLLPAIYNARSRALHNGKPFPDPMLRPPRWESSEGNEADGRTQSAGYIERPDGIASFSHDAVWGVQTYRCFSGSSNLSSVGPCSIGGRSLPTHAGPEVARVNRCLG